MKLTSMDRDLFYKNSNISRLECGDSVRVTMYLDRLIEITKVRSKIQKDSIQVFSGVVIAKSASSTAVNAMITVRRMFKEGSIERFFLLHSPWLKSIKKVESSSICRAKLYYTRNVNTNF